MTAKMTMSYPPSKNTDDETKVVRSLKMPEALFIQIKSMACIEQRTVHNMMIVLLGNAIVKWKPGDRAR